MITKFAQAFFSSLIDEDNEIKDQLLNDFSTASKLGYLDTPQYALSDDSGVITVVDKINDELTRLHLNANGDWEVIEDSNNVTEEYKDVKEFARIEGDGIIFRINSVDVKYNPKTKMAEILDDDNDAKWKVSNVKRLDDFLKEAHDRTLAYEVDPKKIIKGKYKGKPVLVWDSEKKDFVPMSKESDKEFSESTKEYINRVRRKNNLKKFSSKTQSYLLKLSQSNSIKVK